MNAYVICAGVTLVCAALSALVYAAFTAPNGYEDETGFHFGDDDLPDGWC